MKAIICLFSLLAIASANVSNIYNQYQSGFLRNLVDVAVNQATYSSACVSSIVGFPTGFAVTVAISSPDAACTPKITLSTTDSPAKTLELGCTAITTSSTSITCGTVSTAAASRQAGTYKLTNVADSAPSPSVTFATPASQTATFQYKVSGYTAVSATNATIDYSDSTKSTFTVTFTGLAGTTSPKIKLGTSLISNCTLASGVATCTPTSKEVEKNETPYQLKYVDDCEADVAVTGVFVTVSSAFSLKASIVAFLALLIL